jgi:surface polysaccharide O-acyltransferase-like enzyme
MLTASPSLALTGYPRPHLATSTATPRITALDATRIIATLGVIWFHTIEADSLHPSGVLGRYSVSFYTLAAILFLVLSSFRRQRPFTTYAADRLRRLGLPFIAWSILSFVTCYALNNLGYHIDLPQLSSSLLLDGGTLHLWFLPFLLVASLLIYPLARWMHDNRKRQYALAIGAAAFALALDLNLLNWVPIPNWSLLTRFLDLSSYRWSAVYWGVTVAVLWRNNLIPARFLKPFALLGAITLVALTIYQWNYGLVSQLKTYGGLGLLFIALTPWQSRFIHLLAPIGRLSAGIYFAHMPALYIARYLLSLTPSPPTDAMRDYATFALAAPGCILFIYALARIPSLRWLAGVETAIQGNPRPTITPHAEPVARAA